MLGDPISKVAKMIAKLREVNAAPQRVGTGRTFRDRRLVENR